MKTIAFLSILIILSACSSAPTSKEQTTEQTTDTVTAATTKQVQVAEVDANSGATSKQNSSMLNGTLIVPAENNITITLPMGGAIASFTHLPGDYIKKGETVAILENTEFIDLQQNYLEATAQSDLLETEYKRQSALSLEDATSQKRLQQSKADYMSIKSRKDAAAARLKILGINADNITSKGIVNRLIVRAPRNGYISEVMVNQGKFVAAGEPICAIIDKSKILLNLIAYEKDLENIKSGQKIEFKVNGLGDETFTAIVSTVDQQVDPVNRSVKVYARATSTHPDFRPGMYVIAQIK